MIKTERLSIRRVCADDWRSIQQIWADQARSAYAQYDKPCSLDDLSVSRRIARWACFANGNDHIFYAVCLEDTMIGYVSFNRRETGYEIGYCFHSDYHGKGYARESISALLDIMKEKGAHMIDAGTALNNTPSVKLLMALGFRQIGTEKVSFYKDAEGRDIVFDGGIYEKELCPVKTVCGKSYSVIRLLGHGKGGYSWLAECGGRYYVLKQIHHEPCDYYQFGNKIEAEQNDYRRLTQAGIRIPEMIAVDTENECIIKEYIDGETIFDIVRRNGSAEKYLPQVREMAEQAHRAGLNIDYFPTNFVVQNDLIWYVDYECNDYMDEWSFENWGIKYWSRTPEFEEYLKQRGGL